MNRIRIFLAIGLLTALMIPYNNCGKVPTNSMTVGGGRPGLIPGGGFFDGQPGYAPKSGAVSQNNGLMSYRNEHYGYYLNYDSSLKIEEIEMNGKGKKVHFDNSTFATPDKISYFDLEGFHPQFNNKENLLSFLKNRFPAKTWKPNQNSSSEGYFADEVTDTFMEKEYYILTTGGDTLHGHLVVHAEFDGPRLLTPIMDSISIWGTCMFVGSRAHVPGHTAYSYEGIGLFKDSTSGKDVLGAIRRPSDNIACLTAAGCGFLIQYHLNSGHVLPGEEGEINNPANPEKPIIVKYHPARKFGIGRETANFSNRYCGVEVKNHKTFVDDSKVQEYLESYEK